MDEQDDAFEREMRLRKKHLHSLAQKYTADLKRKADEKEAIRRENERLRQEEEDRRKANELAQAEQISRTKERQRVLDLELRKRKRIKLWLIVIGGPSAIIAFFACIDVIGPIVERSQQITRPAQHPQQAQQVQQAPSENTSSRLGMTVIERDRTRRGDRGVTLIRCDPGTPASFSHLATILKWADGRMSAAERWHVDIYQVNGQEVDTADDFTRAVDASPDEPVKLAIFLVFSASEGHYVREAIVDPHANVSPPPEPVPTGGIYYTAEGYRSTDQMWYPPYPPARQPPARPRPRPRATPRSLIPVLRPG